MSILAIDQGTSSTKALLIDGDRVLAAHEVPIRPRYLDGGGVEQDPTSLLDSVLEAGRAVLEAGRAAPGGAGSDVEAVALANQGESVLAWDRATGRPLTPVLGWQDGRAAEVTAALADHADDVAGRTGLALDPYFTAPKMAWLRRHLTREGVVTTTDTWLLNHLTGEFVTDASTASRSLVTDLDAVAWDPGLLRLFELGDEDLPRIIDCDAVVGTTTAFGGVLPVAGVIVDQQAALLAQRCLDPGDSKCTLGTGAFLLAATGRIPVRSAHRLTTSVAWRVRGETTYCLDGQVYTVASAAQWLADLGVIDGAADIDDLAAPESGGAVFVPALAGLAAPWWRSDVGGAFHGLRLASGRGEVVRAVVDGVASSVAVLCQTVAADLGSPLTTLKVDGGLTRSATLVQAIADLAQTPVLVSESPHATAHGAAVVARLALDPALDIAAAIPVAGGGRLVEPGITADQAATRLEAWTRAVDACIAQAASS